MSLSKSSSPHIYSDGEKRHFRIISIINDEGQMVLRLILVKLLAGKTLPERLAEPEIKVKIEDALARTKIHQEQYDILYPLSGVIDIEDIDISLLVFLIRQLHPFMKVSNRIWTTPPHGDLSPEADVTRLKTKRNMLVHLANTTLTDDEFEVEFQELEKILCRLAHFASSAELTVTELSMKLSNKRNGIFESKPSTSNIATSISSSLDKDNTSVSDTSSIYSIHSLPTIGSRSCRVSTTVTKKEAATSTSSLKKKRKLSFKVRSALEPFIVPPKKEKDKENPTHLPKRIKTKDKHKDSRKKCKSCSCTLRGSCRTNEAHMIKTNDHSFHQYRCHIAGLTILSTDFLMVADTSHDVVQALTPSGDIIDEFECAQPNSVVAVGADKFAVTLRQSCKVKILKYNKVNNCIESENEFDIDCNSWLSDMKHSNGYLYTICENGDLHILNLRTGSNEGILHTKVQCPSHFDITKRGDRLFISHSHHITCLDGFGNKVWCYSDKSKRTFKGIVLHKNMIFACAWDKGKVIGLASEDGKYLKEYSDEQMRYPWSLCLHKGKLFVSQFMSTLNTDSCREIVVMKI